VGKVHAFPSGVDARMRVVRKLLEQLPQGVGFVLGVQNGSDPLVLFTNIEQSDLATLLDEWIEATTGVPTDARLASDEVAQLRQLSARVLETPLSFPEHVRQLARLVLEVTPFEAYGDAIVSGDGA